VSCDLHIATQDKLVSREWHSQPVVGQSVD
jgi:hypothetical protein